MTFNDQVIQDLEAVFFNEDEFASPATYTPPGGGVSVSISAIKSELEMFDDAPMQGALQDVAVIRVLESQIANPAHGAKITIDGVDWTVDRSLGHAAGTWKLSVYRDLRPTHK